MNITKQQRSELRMKFGGRCAYCGCELAEKGWHADHVEPVMREWWKRTAQRFKYEVRDGQVTQVPVELDKIGLERPENDVLSNLFPACRSCNLDKSCMSLETWRSVLQDKVGVCRRNHTAFQHAERFGMVKEITGPIIFWFEKYVDPRTLAGA